MSVLKLIDKKEKIRVYVIADDYRYHICTDDKDHFRDATLAYLKLMGTSKKQNHYYFKNLFMTVEEYEQIISNL